MTQATLAKFITKPNGRPIQRTTVAQWERGDSVPSISTIEQVAQLLNVRSKFLSYGDTDEPIVKAPDPDEMGYAHVPEIVFGATHEEQREYHKWGLPTGFLCNEMGIGNLTHILIYKVEVTFRESKFELGDRLIVDTSMTRPSPPGTFLYWDDVGPAIGDMTVLPPIHVAGKKGPPQVMVKVTTADSSYEASLESLVIIGRIKGKLGKL